MAGLTFLCAVWNIYSSKLDIDQNLQTQILQLLQKATRDTSHTLNIYAMMLAFRLLDHLAVKKASSAANVYRKLTFILVENYDNLDHRQFLMNNFVHIFRKFPSIPLDIIIDPLVKLLQSNHAMNLNDAILFNSITSHQNLKQSAAILMLDALVRLYNTNYMFAQTIFPSIQKLLSKFIDDPTF